MPPLALPAIAEPPPGCQPRHRPLDGIVARHDDPGVLGHVGSSADLGSTRAALRQEIAAATHIPPGDHAMNAFARLLAVAPLAAALAAQNSYETDFESLTGSPAGTPLAGQASFFI